MVDMTQLAADTTVMSSPFPVKGSQIAALEHWLHDLRVGRSAQFCTEALNYEGIARITILDGLPAIPLWL